MESINDIITILLSKFKTLEYLEIIHRGNHNQTFQNQLLWKQITYNLEKMFNHCKRKKNLE